MKLQSIVSELLSRPDVLSVVRGISSKALPLGINALEEVMKALESLSFQIVLKGGALFTAEQIACCNDCLDDVAGRRLVVGSTTDYRQIAVALDNGELAVIPKESKAFRKSTQSSSADNECTLDMERTIQVLSTGGYAIPLMFRLCRDLRAMTEVCLGGKRLYSPANARFLNWLKARNAPQPLCNLFSWFMPRAEIAVGSGTINDYSEIMAVNDAWPEAMDCGLFIIGYCPNGDMIAVRTQENETGYISHEEIDHDGDMGTHFFPIANSFSAFFHDANMFGYCPTDYWQAKELAWKRSG